MKVIALFLLLPFFVQAQFVDLYKISETKLDPNKEFSIQHEMNPYIVPEFYVSNQITVWEYGVFLRSVQYDSSELYFQSMLPDLELLGFNSLEDYFGNLSYADDPVMGVSWCQAFEFCNWLNDVSGIRALSDHYYRMPLLTEWIAMDKHLDKKKGKDGLKENGTLLDWTLTNRDETSLDIFFQNTREFKEFTYFAMETDPPSLKRKIAKGKSYSGQNIFGYGRTYYQDSAYAEVGFRVIYAKTSLSNTLYGPFTNPPENNRTEILMNYSGDNGYIIHSSDKIKQGEFLQIYKDKSTVEGHYQWNQKNGIWTLSDPKKKVLDRRLYNDNQHFVRLIRSENENASTYKADWKLNPPAKYRNGVPLYDYVTEGDVLYSKRMWRLLYADSNAHINGSEMYQRLIAQAMSDDIHAYNALDDQFRTALSHEQVELISNKSFEVIGFEIKEDFFLDAERRCAEARIIGIAPFYMLDGKRIKVCWFYYPEIRPILWELALLEGNKSKWTNTDEAMNHRYFYAPISRVSMIYSRTANDSIDSQEEELKLLQTEHAYWLKQLKGHDN